MGQKFDQLAELIKIQAQVASEALNQKFQKKFNAAANLFKSKARIATEELHKELSRNLLTADMETITTFSSAQPSLEKVKQLIADGAKVNEPLNDNTPLWVCARNYKDVMAYTQDIYTISHNGQVITKDEWRAEAKNILEIANTLIKAGADPRSTMSFNNTAVKLLEMNSGNFEDLKELTDLLNKTTMLLNKRDAAATSAAPKKN